jgi:hypothetical protein
MFAASEKQVALAGDPCDSLFVRGAAPPDGELNAMCKPTGCQLIGAILRFEKKLDRQENGCRVWTGAQTKGGKGRCKRDRRRKRKNSGGPYGKFWVGPGQKDTVQAHVFAAFLAGKIPTLRVPDGIHLDHFCQHATLCVDCVEPVTCEENLRRRHTRPLPKADRPAPSKLRRRRRAVRKGPGNPKKFAPSENKGCITG